MASQTMGFLDRTVDSDDEDDDGQEVEGVDFRRFYLIKMLVTQQNWFHYVVAALLGCNTLAMCFEADYPELEIWSYVNLMFVVVFVTELALRLITYGLPFFYNEEWRWNVFDFLVVMVACTDMVLHTLRGADEAEVGAVTSIRVVRMLRILRVFRLLRQFDELQLLARGLLESAEYVLWTFLLLAMLVFTCAILCTMVIWRRKEVFEDPELIELYWGGVLTSSLTLFQFLTLDDWGTIARQVAAELPAMVCVFVPYIVMAAFVVLSLLTGVMAEHMQEVRVKEGQLRRHTREFEVKKTMRELYNVFIEHCERIGPGDLVEASESGLQGRWRVVQLEDVEETLLLRRLTPAELLACERAGLATPAEPASDAQPETVRIRERDASKLRVLDLGDTTVGSGCCGAQKISKGKFVRMMQTPHVRRHLKAQGLDVGFQSFGDDEVEEVFEALDTLKAGALGWDEFHQGLQQTRQSITSRQIARLQCGVSAIARRLDVKFPHQRENQQALDPGKVQRQLARLLAHVNHAAEDWDSFSDTLRNHLDDLSPEHAPLSVSPVPSQPLPSRESSVAPLLNGGSQPDVSKLGWPPPRLSTLRSPSPISSEASLAGMRPAMHAHSAPLSAHSAPLSARPDVGPRLSPRWLEPALTARSWSSPRLAPVSRSLSPPRLARAELTRQQLLATPGQVAATVSRSASRGP